jgi:hypothetical protein
VTDPGGSQRVRIGVVLAERPADLGEWLADGAAFDAAGADALWIDPAPELELDALALAAALAAVTFRSLLVCVLPVPGVPSPAVARTIATIGALSRGRLRILGRGTGFGSAVGSLVPVAGAPGSFEYSHLLDGTQRWVSVPPPDGRASWRATLLDAARGGVRGVLVPAGPRLIDILRNPDDPGQRLDLHLAQG